MCCANITASGEPPTTASASKLTARGQWPYNLPRAIQPFRSKMPGKSMPCSRFTSRLVVALGLFALATANTTAQAPPGVESEPSAPKLSLRELFNDGSADIGGEHVRFSGSFAIEKGTRQGTLTIS